MLSSLNQILLSSSQPNFASFFQPFFFLCLTFFGRHCSLCRLLLFLHSDLHRGWKLPKLNIFAAALGGKVSEDKARWWWLYRRHDNKYSVSGRIRILRTVYNLSVFSLLYTFMDKFSEERYARGWRIIHTVRTDTKIRVYHFWIST